MADFFSTALISTNKFSRKSLESQCKMGHVNGLLRFNLRLEMPNDLFLVMLIECFMQPVNKLSQSVSCTSTDNKAEQCSTNTVSTDTTTLQHLCSKWY